MIRLKEAADNFKIAIIGLGYVGLPLAQLFLQKNQTVYGIDLDERKLATLGKYQSYLSDFTAKEIRQLFAGGRFHVGRSFEAIAKADAVIICVPTPLDAAHKPDLKYVRSAVESALPHLRRGQLVVLESSTYPGTTEEVLLPLIESTGLKTGRDIFLAYSPERIDPGQKRMPLEEIPKVAGGMTEECTQFAKRVYEKAFKHVVVVSSPRVAEMTKILENCQRLVNISFMNELTMLCQKLDINLWEAIDAASTKPYGFTPYYPGPGIGGHCIPVDPLYLFWKAKEHGVHLSFIDAAHHINQMMPEFVVQRTKQLLETSKPIQEASIFVIGVTYKKDVNDMRESRALDIIEGLMMEGATVHYFDPYIKEITVAGKQLKSYSLSKKNASQHDCTLILADHSNLPYNSLVEYSPLVIDTRNATQHCTNKKNVVLL